MMKIGGFSACKLIGTLTLIGVLSLAFSTGATEDGQLFRYGTDQEVHSFDPAKVSGDTCPITLNNIYDPMVFPVAGEQPKAWLAEDWGISEDGMQWTFYIRKGVRFHDGSELTAEDVAFTMDRELTIRQGYSFIWADVLSPGDVEALDTYTVKFNLRKPFSPLLASLVQLRVINKDLVLANLKSGEYGELGDYGQDFLEHNDAGSGPYTLEVAKRAELIVLRRFDDYWKGWPDPEHQIGTAELRVLPEEVTEVTMFKMGELDMVEQWLSPKTFEELKTVPGVVVEENVDANPHFITMNTQKKPFDDINVRKAVAYALDYDSMLNYIFKGGVRSQGPVPLISPCHNDQVEIYETDLERAKQCLQESKYSMEELRSITIQIMNDTGEIPRTMAALIKNNLEELGLRAKIVTETWSRFTEQAASPETTLHINQFSQGMKYPSPDAHTTLMFHPSSHGSWMAVAWYDNPEATQYMEMARSATDPNESCEYYKKVQEILVEDYAAIWEVNSLHRIAHWDYLTGWTFPGVFAWEMWFWDWRIEK